MPKIHVIYDPQDRIHHDSQLNKRMGIKVAILSLGDDSFANIGATAETLTNLLLCEIEKDAGG